MWNKGVEARARAVSGLRIVNQRAMMTISMTVSDVDTWIAGILRSSTIDRGIGILRQKVQYTECLVRRDFGEKLFGEKPCFHREELGLGLGSFRTAKAIFQKLETVSTLRHGEEEARFMI
jgi:hypothetical protein